MWEEVKGWPYEVSERGEVFSLNRDKILKPCIKGGYSAVTLQNKGKKRQVYIHILVAEAFLFKPALKKRLQVNHIDGNKLNNRRTNLEYVTPLQNTSHAIALGLYNNTGENNGRSKLQSRHIKAIRALKGLLDEREIADLFRVGKTAINDIFTGKSWRHL
tara:strand:- start:1900 stop:2379 length:480 start_codon:yes stop_codon:yes gene_type:complete